MEKLPDIEETYRLYDGYKDKSDLQVTYSTVLEMQYLFSNLNPISRLYSFKSYSYEIQIFTINQYCKLIKISVKRFVGFRKAKYNNILNFIYNH